MNNNNPNINNKNVKNNRSKKSHNNHHKAQNVNHTNGSNSSGKHQKPTSTSSSKQVKEHQASNSSIGLHSNVSNGSLTNVGTFKNNDVGEKRADVEEIKTRYWKYLFDNLERSINEIYQTCENDNEISKCKVRKHFTVKA